MSIFDELSNVNFFTTIFGAPPVICVIVVKEADPRALDLVLVYFQPIPGSRIGELSARFDIVISLTPEAPTVDPFLRCHFR